MTIHTANRLENDPRIWRASQHKTPNAEAVATGFPELDHLLATSGWPRGALIECHCPDSGIGEIRLFRRVMELCSGQGQTVFWVDPPHTPYAPGLSQFEMALEHFFLIRTNDDEDRIWTLEQLLKCPAAGLVMGWSPSFTPAHLRRLQLAAEGGDTMGVVVITSGPVHSASPAPVRLALTPALTQGLRIDIQRQRGGQAGRLSLALPPLLPDHGSGSEGH
jgi:hypothetical protein